jgi:hypothetical protein
MKTKIFSIRSFNKILRIKKKLKQKLSIEKSGLLASYQLRVLKSTILY